MAVVIDRLPAPVVLLVFLVPFLIVEPMLVVATVAIAMGYFFWGAVAWIVLKVVAFAVIPSIFDLTKHRLMTMPWFVWVFDKVWPSITTPTGSSRPTSRRPRRSSAVAREGVRAPRPFAGTDAAGGAIRLAQAGVDRRERVERRRSPAGRR